MFLASDKGKRILNFFYSWGASIVILGALFKILHLPYANLMLAVGMTTEFFVFFIFGFEKPSADYQSELPEPTQKDLEHISNVTESYISQMEKLNRNISGLNAIYETQLKSICSQAEKIDHKSKEHDRSEQ